MIIQFSDNRVYALNKVGGKGRNLMLLVSKGFEVPDGFVISFDAYDAYIQGNAIDSTIEEIMHMDILDKEKSVRIQQLFCVDGLSRQLTEEMLRAFDALDSERVAVRSSSSLEDMHGFSFAGQYSSYLGVKREGLLEAVIECWKSLWNERAIAYRRVQLQNDKPAHAVVVQAMVDAQCSGVLFTANPINGSRDEVVINASYGLGEAIVSGEVMPDQYVYDQRQNLLLDSKINEKEILYRYGQKGIEKTQIEMKMKSRQVLDRDAIKELVEAGQRIQAVYGSPQDIEFAVDFAGRLFILQARPITTLYPIDTFEQDGKLHAYLAASSVLLGMKEPFTPLGADVYGGMFPKVIEVMTRSKGRVSSDFVKYAGARIFVDITYLMSSKFVAKNFAAAFSGSDMPLKSTFDLLTKKHGETFTHQGIRFRIPWGIVKYGFSMIPLMRKVSKIDDYAKYGAVKKLGEETLADLEARAALLKTIEEKLVFCDEMMLRVFMLSQIQAMYCTQVSAYPKLQKRIQKMFGSKYDLDVLSYALPGCITVEMNMEMNALAKHFSLQGIQPNAEDPMFKAFLDKYGHRGTIELDFGTPRWKEAPAYLLSQITLYMKDNAYERSAQAHADNISQAEKMIDDIYADTLQFKGKRYAQRLRRSLETYRIAAGMREYPKFNILQGLYLGRKVVLSAGHELVRRGLMDQAEDIFYVHRVWLLDYLQRFEQDAVVEEHTELKSIFAAEVEKNKQTYRRELKRKSIPRIVLNTGEMFFTGTVESDSSSLIKGYSLSSGVHVGKIKIVHNPETEELEEGEIMVAESTNPAWTPLFMTAGGLIMEYGGPLSHGGIVAREYGIPAVVGISPDTVGLKNGQLVRVDGYNGTIEILDNSTE